MPINETNKSILLASLIENNWIAKYVCNELHQAIDDREDTINQVVSEVTIIYAQSKPVPYATIKAKYTHPSAININDDINNYLEKWVNLLYPHQRTWVFPCVDIISHLDKAINDLYFGDDKKAADLMLNHYVPNEEIKTDINRGIAVCLSIGEQLEQMIITGPKQ